ncbi:hypothetical protein AB0903_30260 [Streptomyces sp. NPDC048389]|uniref:hypothetical protein n=1 Tax=Streptomyces sp. NPDC048389 TaxID=3154622 RepID=UPI0034520725
MASRTSRVSSNQSSSSSTPVVLRIVQCQVSRWDAVCPVRGFRKARGSSSSSARYGRTTVSWAVNSGD